MLVKEATGGYELDRELRANIPGATICGDIHVVCELVRGTSNNGQFSNASRIWHTRKSVRVMYRLGDQNILYEQTGLHV